MTIASVLTSNKSKDFLVWKAWEGRFFLLNNLKHQGGDQQVVSAHHLLEGEVKLTGTDGSFFRELSPSG